jgi:nuclear pore complex protein Nup107
MHSSRLFYELVIVREWLHDTAPPPPVPDAATGYWKFTKYQLMQALRTGNRMQSDGLVREMDPDAPNRDNTRGLAADDAVRTFAPPEIYYK